jgi:hypothetical protein
MVPLPEVGNLISRTALTIRFLHFLARAHVQSRKSRVALCKTLPLEYWREEGVQEQSAARLRKTLPLKYWREEGVQEQSAARSDLTNSLEGS